MFSGNGRGVNDRIPTPDYKSLCADVKIYATLVNTQTRTQAESF